MTEECRQGFLLPTHIANVPTRNTYSLTGAEEQALNPALKIVKEMTFAINSERMELHEHAIKVHGLKDLLLAQNRDVRVLAIKKLGAKESIDSQYSLETCAFWQKNL